MLILTGQSDYEIDLEAAALGVTDYLVEQELDPISLERSIRYDVSHQKALHDLTLSEERYALAVRAANDGIRDWDLGAGRIYFSPRWYAILGRAERMGDEDLLESEHRIRHSDGTWRWVLSRGLAIRDEDGRATRMAGSLSDITDRLSAERQFHDALYDVLTGLPNRALFTDRVTQVMQRAVREPGIGCAVLFVDIDRFKLVNDSLSHAVGDQLLVALAARLSSVLRPGDTVARIGGDELAAHDRRRPVAQRGHRDVRREAPRAHAGALLAAWSPPAPWRSVPRSHGRIQFTCRRCPRSPGRPGEGSRRARSPPPGTSR